LDSIRTQPDFDEVIAHGPDLLVLDVGCDNSMIGEALPAAHGKPLMFVVHPEGCCEEALVQAAAWGDVTAAIPIRGPVGQASDFVEMLESATDALIQSGVETGRVRVAGWMQEGEGDPEQVAACRIERLVADLRSHGDRGRARAGEPCVSSWLADALEAARSVAVPVYCALDPETLQWADEIVEAGIGGVIVPPDETQPWKAALRNAVWAVLPEAA
jgi:hypothetical protein